MACSSGKLACQLREFIFSKHIYADELSEEVMEKIFEAADREPEESVPSNITKRKGKARRSLAPRYPSEWASSKQDFLKAVKQFETLGHTSQDEPIREQTSYNLVTPMSFKQKGYERESHDIKKSHSVQNIKPSAVPIISIIPREITSLFSGFEKLNDENWDIWRGHMQDNLEICNLWDIVTGIEQKPTDLYPDLLESWTTRERIAKVVIKNSLGSKDYKQVRHANTSACIWKTLASLHQATGAQGKMDLIWKFWNMRCEEGASVQEHIGEIRAIHRELADLGIFIENHLLALLLSKSLPSSYESCVSTIFAGIKDLEEADPEYVANKIVEEEMRRNSRSQEAHLVNPKRCYNCGKPGHMKNECYAKGGGKEGQGPRQIARRKKAEAESRKEQENNQVKLADEEVFYTSHMALLDYIQNENCFTSYSWSSESWIADSGASVHIANHREMFTSFTPKKSILNVAGGLTATVEGTGVVYMQGKINGQFKIFKLIDVLYVPTTRYCLISVPKIDKAGGRFICGNDKCTFWNTSGEAIATGYLEGNLYRVNAKALISHNPTANSVTTPVVSWHEAHRLLGHISLSSMRVIFKKSLVEGLKVDKNEPIPLSLSCRSCIEAKAHRAPFPSITEKRTKIFGELIHTDVWGSPNMKQTPGGNQYFILFIDDYTRYVTVKLMRSKACVKQQLMNHCNFIYTQYNRWPKEVRSDNAAEYEGTRNWLEERGIKLKPSAPHSPQQNGVSERMNRTILELARAMRFEKNLPESLWGEAVLHAAWIRNRSPTKALDDKTPIETLTGILPNLSMAREFGDDVFVLEELPKSKIEPKARKVIFTGFEDGPKAIRYYDPNTKRIRISRNYNFMPNQKIDVEIRDMDLKSREPNMITDENQSKVTGDRLEEDNKIIIQDNSVDERQVERLLRSRTESGKTTRRNYSDLAGFNPRNYIRQPKTGQNVYLALEARMNGDHFINSSYFANFAHDLMNRNGDNRLPNTIQEARESMDSENWEVAVETELSTLREKNTWELVDPPKDKNIIGNRWVFTKKYDENGKLCKFKARLVAQGYNQGYIYDYSDTFSPVVRFDSFRILLAIAAYHSLALGQMDVKGAYLNGKLSEEIYMRQPKGCEDGTGRVCRLMHTLYGLKQSGREWNKTLKKFLVDEAGYAQLTKEHGLFYRSDIKGYDIIAVWVDDFLIASSDDIRLQKTKCEIGNKWESTDLGEPKMLLGIQLKRNPEDKSIKIYQEQYILKILRRFGMENCNPANTPLAPGVIYEKSGEDEVFEDTTEYRSAIGSLMFAAIATRPDIAYATNLLSQFNGAPGQKHWNGVKQIFRYLKGTISTGILYSKIRHTEPQFTLTAFSDADNGKGYDRKSISGSVITISGGAVKWAAEKQRLITVSTSESEYVAANLTGRNCLFLRDIMEELGFPHKEPIPLFMDSDGAIALTKNPENMRATMHIDKIYHWIRQHVEEGTFSPESIPGKENPADIFTKSLVLSSFQKHKMNIGMIE